MICPNCGGDMWEHDVGYDECKTCDFFAIYDDGREPPVWTEKERERIYAAELVRWKKEIELGDEQMQRDWPEEAYED